MVKQFGLRVVILVALVLFFSGIVLAATPEFSADMIMTDAKGKVTQGKIYVQGTEKMRQEFQEEDDVTVTIVRLDKKVSWTLLPQQQYMEMSFTFDPYQLNRDFEYEMAVLGSETINGYPCQIIQYTYKDRKYGILVQWFSEELGFAVKQAKWNGQFSFVPESLAKVDWLRIDDTTGTYSIQLMGKYLRSSPIVTKKYESGDLVETWDNWGIPTFFIENQPLPDVGKTLSGSEVKKISVFSMLYGPGADVSTETEMTITWRFEPCEP